MKQRYTFLDIRAIVNELNERLVGKHIQNFYSTSQRILYIKFSNKDILLIEPGVRIHLTDEHDTDISHFCKILRKRARRDRVVNIYQSGFDRVIVLELNRQKIIFEFYSAGNILIMEENEVVDVFRVVKELNIVKGTPYVLNKVDFDFSFDSFIENNLNDFLPLDELLVNQTLKELSAELNVKNVLDIKESVANGIPVKNEIKEKFNEFMKAFKEKIENIKNCGSVIMKKSQLINLVPFEVEGAKKFPTFNEAAEFFFSSRKITKKNKTEESKVDRIRQRQENYMKDLTTKGEKNEEKAVLLEKNYDLVSNVLKIFKNIIKNKMKWEDFDRFWESEKKKGNEVAKCITKTDFLNNKCWINLEGKEIEIDFTLSIHSNVSNYYQQRKKMEEKVQKTRNVIEEVLKKVEPKKKPTKKITRNLYWFEKFNFFFSSDNVLVYGGKNAQQNEIIVKKHLDSKDLYFHSDISGASSIVVKNPTENTIKETATMALCMSKCWDQNVVSQVWYVSGDQVSKTAPSGEHLTKGSFMIRGKKNYVDVFRLEYGLGLLFKVEDEITQQFEELNINEDEEKKEEKFNFISDPTDKQIIHAMPVCAPWSVISTYKFKVRLLPGREKRGKLAQDISKKFVSQSDDNERSFVNSISTDEYINVLFGTAKIGKQ